MFKSASSISFSAVMLCVLGVGWAQAASGEPAKCQNIRLSDVGWTDNQAVNGFAGVILSSLGYKPGVTIVSMPVILEGLKNNDLDVHMDFWTPGADSLTDPYLKEGSVEKVQTYLTGAQYTLAAPTYLWNDGLKSFADIAKFKDRLGGKIYGIEAGNDGNETILKMIKENMFGLGDFKLVESSEQGMLSQVSHVEKSKEAIVFLGWSPHPMNTEHDFKYLSGGEELFGAGSTGWIAARKGYTAECPNVARFLKNFTLSIDAMNVVMGYIINDSMTGDDAALKWLRNNPEALNIWLADVNTFDGGPGLQQVTSKLTK